MSEQPRLTPQRIAMEQKIYNIPIYQRLFEWDDEKIKNLLNDLFFAYLNNKVEPYYIGMLTANEQENEQDLVDGQQRFTVSTLIGVIFKQYYSDWNDFLLVDGKPRLHFSAREEDYDFLLKVIKDRNFLSQILSAKPCDFYVNKRMADGLKTIHKWIPQDYEGDWDKGMFAKYVFDQMSFFITELPKDYKARDLNRYFESMNSLGRNLESYEILEVDCLKKLPTGCDLNYYNKIWNLVSDMDTLLVRKISHKDKSKRETEEEYDTRFKSLIATTIGASDLESITSKLKRNGKYGLNDFGDSDISESLTIGEIKADQNSKPSPRFHEGSHHSMLNFTEFLLQVLYIHNGYVDDSTESITVNEFFDVHKLAETYETHIMKCWKEEPEDCKRFFLNLLKYRLIYDYYIIRIANMDGEDYELEMSDNSENSSKDIGVLKKFQSMLYAGSASKTFYRWVARLLSEIDKRKADVTSVELYHYLLDIDSEIRESEGNNLPLSSDNLRYDTDVPLYWFRRLDFILWKKIVVDEDFSSALIIDKDVVASMKFRRGGRSIEHLHPQNQDNNQKWEVCNIHEFGNLALVTGSFNSEQSNDNLDVKFGRIKQQVDSHQLQSIKMYLMYLEANCDGTKWTESKMLQHRDSMIEILNNNVDSKNSTIHK